MRMLADRHHADLFYGIGRTFEDRLGYEVWAPGDLGWFDEGYWRFGAEHLGRQLADQFLGIDAKYAPGDVPGTWTTHDPAHPERLIRVVSLDAARAMAWDLVLASVQDNQAGLHRFADEHGARFVYHVGNTGQAVDWGLSGLILMASEVPVPDGARAVVVGEEFDSDAMYRYRPPRHRREPRVVSFVNCMSHMGACWDEMLRYREALSDWDWRIYGIDNPDGVLKPVDAIAAEMAGATFAWHDKAHGDGFGHVVHSWAAVGRPLVGHAAHYAGKRAERLWSDGTSVDLGARPFDENVAMLREIAADRRRHGRMCRAIRARFGELTDWPGDAERIAEALR